MKKVLIGTILGFFLFGSGLYVGYLTIGNIRDGGSPLLILGSVILCVAGMFLLYKAGRIDTFKSKIAPLNTNASAKSMLEKNQEIIKEWNDTNDKRDKLKMLEAAGAAEEGQ